MFELIFFIILVSVLVKKNKQKQADPKKQNPYPIPPAPPKTSSSSVPQTNRPRSNAPRSNTPHSKEARSKTTAGKTETKRPDPIKEEAKKQPETATYIEPTRPYRPAHNAGERYETWFPIPEGKEVCHCNYCGADNLIPKRKDPHLFTCYFCREELSD